MIRRRRVSLVVVAAAIMMQVAVGSSFSSPASAVDYNQLRNGFQSAIDMDWDCYWRWVNNAGLPTKNRVNAAAYHYYGWISAAGTGSKTTIDVPAGSTDPIPLQYNFMMGLCGAVTGSGTNDVNVINSRVRTDGLDYAPAPENGYNNSPNWVRYGYIIWGLSDGGKGGSFSGYSPGTPLIAYRNASTRFWLATPMTFYYTPPPGGFNSTTTVSIRANYGAISQSYFLSQPYYQIDCLTGGPTWNKTWSPNGQGLGDIEPGNAHWYLSQCGRQDTDTPVTFNVPLNYTLTPSAGVGKGLGLTGQHSTSVEVQAGTSITFNTFVSNSGPTETDGIGWKVVGWKVPADKVAQYNSDISSKFASGVYNIPTANPYSSVAASENPKVGISSAIDPLPGVTNWNLGHTASRSPYNPFVMNPGADDYRQYNAGASGVSLFNIDSNQTPISTNNLNVGDLICVSAAVSPWAESTRASRGDTRFSKPACALITKTPQLQLRGADSYSGAKYWGSTANVINKKGSFEGSPSGVNTLRGSWSQYGLLATGYDATSNSTAEITNFGSAGWTSNTTNALKACKLLFANTNGSGNTSNCNNTFLTQSGRFGESRTINLPDAAKLTATQIDALPSAVTSNCTYLSATVACSNLSMNSGTYGHSGNLAITGATSTATPGKNLTIVVNGDVYLGGGTDIWKNARTMEHSDLGQVPSLTIIANNIFVYNGTTPTNYLYGTYIAGATGSGTGAFYSCGKTGTGSLVAPTNNSAHLSATGACSGASSASGNGQLQIDGALVTKDSPRFQRTFGGGTTDPAVPAEIVNYTPNLFLTPYYINTTIDGDTNWETVNQTGLPARY